MDMVMDTVAGDMLHLMVTPSHILDSPASDSLATQYRASMLKTALLRNEENKSDK